MDTEDIFYDIAVKVGKKSYAMITASDRCNTILDGIILKGIPYITSVYYILSEYPALIDAIPKKYKAKKIDYSMIANWVMAYILAVTNSTLTEFYENGAFDTLSLGYIERLNITRKTKDDIAKIEKSFRFHILANGTTDEKAINAAKELAIEDLLLHLCGENLSGFICSEGLTKEVVEKQMELSDSIPPLLLRGMDDEKPLVFNMVTSNHYLLVITNMIKKTVTDFISNDVGDIFSSETLVYRDLKSGWDIIGVPDDNYYPEDPEEILPDIALGGTRGKPSEYDSSEE